MGGNTFGNILKLTTFGESHGKATGGVVEGFPSDFPLDTGYIQQQLDRRKPAAASHSTSRKEDDKIEIVSGIFNGRTLGTPIAFFINNKDSNPDDYEELKDIFRPSHADYSWERKYGYRDYRGGGRSSARETAARVAGGAMALQYLEAMGISIISMVTSIGGIESQLPGEIPSKDEIERHELRCPDTEAEEKMLKLIKKTKSEKDSLGGVITTFITGLPAGLGEPVFDKFQSRLAAAMMSINAAKGFEYGQGFAAATMKGSEHNDNFIFSNNEIIPETNNAGGILGGITTGEFINFNIAFKPVSSIGKTQQTVDSKGITKDLTVKGRHDVTVVPRAVPIVEAMAALVTMDFVLLQKLSKL